jgi:hypothetical protein
MRTAFQKEILNRRDHLENLGVDWEDIKMDPKEAKVRIADWAKWLGLVHGDLL